MHYCVDDKVLDFSKTEVMGILNVTPDSFFDGGSYCSLARAIDHVASMVSFGARFIDVGGESTRPGFTEVSEDEEVNRVVPVVSAISKRFNVFISVNTSKALVIRESAKVGANLINDIRSLSDRKALEACLSYPHLSVCIMHMRSILTDRQRDSYYHNIVKEVNDYFKIQIMRCEFFGISRSRLFLDPGFCFGKKLIHNYQLLAHLGDFKHFKLPIIVGISRKSMLDLFGNRSLDQRLIGSISCAVISALQGIQILRVHDVKETMEALECVCTTLKYRKKYFI